MGCLHGFNLISFGLLSSAQPRADFVFPITLSDRNHTPLRGNYSTPTSHDVPHGYIGGIPHGDFRALSKVSNLATNNGMQQDQLHARSHRPFCVNVSYRKIRKTLTSTQ
ncbi:hypothetical protein BKA66DRAFT_298670 [Pyrenochaeta sp. MPI-SDFR-AT-0127]|nr:hypothetical protein BKA66DRAFT_298670 [Pyrenochaeta sp. MPI-SDFR-AT-0127]